VGTDNADPFDPAAWPMPAMALELEALATEVPRRDRSSEAAAWVVDRAGGGVATRELCEAALWVGLRNSRSEGRGPGGLVTHSLLAAHASDAIASLAGDDEDDRRRIATLAALQLCAYTAGSYRGGINDPKEGPSRLAWFDHELEGDGDPIDGFLDAAASGETELADHAWLRAAHHDPAAAEATLVSAGAAGYHLNEHKLIYPAQLRAWVGDDAPLSPVLFRAAARYAGNPLQDWDLAQSRRADAAVLAEMLAEDPSAGQREHDDARVSVVATGIAQTPTNELEPLLVGSLQDGLSPEELVAAVSLVSAARLADTTFDASDPGAPVAALHAGTGANAVRRCLERASDAPLRYELALCATRSPNARRLAGVAELSVPPSDGGALEDLLASLVDGDPDGAADAASAIPPDDSDATSFAWRAVAAAAVTDQWMLLHATKLVVAMHEDFEQSTHPARIWFLAAAARVAAHAAMFDQPLAANLPPHGG
jgi:hypothetical protein